MSTPVVILFGTFIGTFVGWLLAAVQEVDEGIFASMVLGAIGAVIGLLIGRGLMHAHSTIVWDSLLSSILGAVVTCVAASFIQNPNKNSGV